MILKMDMPGRAVAGRGGGEIAFGFYPEGGDFLWVTLLYKSLHSATDWGIWGFWEIPRLRFGE
jgi:hypothetical protein